MFDVLKLRGVSNFKFSRGIVPDAASWWRGGAAAHAAGLNACLVQTHAAGLNCCLVRILERESPLLVLYVMVVVVVVVVMMIYVTCSIQLLDDASCDT